MADGDTGLSGPFIGTAPTRRWGFTQPPYSVLYPKGSDRERCKPMYRKHEDDIIDVRG